MYRVMLIDDENSARQLLLSAINWQELNMEVVGDASSGIEAINTIDEIRPDIAFVDISMPFMNGIEFTRLATQRYPNLKIIILTAFDEFEYARQCVSLPVCEYMLKPLVRTEAIEALTRVKEQLDSRHDSVSDSGEGQSIEPSTIERITAYIDEHFTDPELNLTAVAQQFCFNSSYLSRKFKAEKGKSFVEYLTECRMKKAIELAKNNEKMFCTAAIVGIPDPNYFGRCFKRYTGMSYSDFLKKL